MRIIAIIILTFFHLLSFAQDSVYGKYYDPENSEIELEIQKKGNFIYNITTENGFRSELGRWEMINDTICFSCEMPRDELIDTIISETKRDSRIKIEIYELDCITRDIKSDISELRHVKLVTSENTYDYNDSSIIYINNSNENFVLIKYKHITDTIKLDKNFYGYKIFLNDLKWSNFNTLKHTKWLVTEDKIVPIIFDKYLEFNYLKRK